VTPVGVHQTTDNVVRGRGPCREIDDHDPPSSLPAASGALSAPIVTSGISEYNRLPPVARVATRAEWLTLIGLWLLLVVQSVGPTTSVFRLAGVPMTHRQITVYCLMGTVLWIALTPLLFMLFDRTPVTGRARVRNFTLRVVTVVVAAACHTVVVRTVMFALVPVMGIDPRFYTTELMSWSSTLQSSFNEELIIVLAHVVLQRVHRSRMQQRRAADLEASLIRAKLHALSKELQPHFLFNTLNGIAALMPDDPRLAEAMIVRLGDLLRITLDEVSGGELALGVELERLDLYLDLQQMRFGPRLTVTRDVARDALEARVPAMVLQPLVENALTHGIGPRPGPGTIGITAYRCGERLRITVDDTGVGLPANLRARESTGLRNTRKRLAVMFPANHRFDIGPGPGGRGTLVTIEIPFRTVAPPELETPPLGVTVSSEPTVTPSSALS
jgi:two-component system, LytTR family, sensor kinase